MKSGLLLALMLLAACQAFTQKLFPPSYHTSDNVPDWVHLMNAPDPNVFDVDRAYDSYYRSHPFEKTSWTQYYKKWRRAVHEFTDARGFVRPPSPQAEQVIWNAYSQIRNAHTASHARTSAAAVWSCLGPYETWWDQSNGEACSWQVNVYCLDQSASQNDVLYCGTETAEIYKTTNRGVSWFCVSRGIAIPSLTAIKIHPTDTATVFAGGGNIIYKTTNGGVTWDTVLNVSNLSPYDIIINPANPLIVIAATSKGLYRSTNAGANWTNIYTNKCWDVEFKPGDPSIVYSVRNNATAIKAEFWKSTDGGATFTIRSNNWYNSIDPNRSDGGAKIAVTPADVNRVYAYLIGESKSGDNGFIGIWKSTDAGENWDLPHGQIGGPYSCPNANSPGTCPFPNLTTIGAVGSYHQGFYNMDIVCSSTDANKLLIGGCSLWRSDDGGTTYSGVGGYSGPVGKVHPDVQDLLVTGNEVWVATDGGINRSTDFMLTHTSRKYGITGSDYWGFDCGWNEDVLVGGRYHNGNGAYFQAYPSATHLRMGGGEAPTGYVSPGNARKTYFSDLGGRWLPSDINFPITGFSVAKWPNESYYAAHSSEMEFDPRCYNHIYLGSDNTLWKSTNGGASFDSIRGFGNDPANDVVTIEVARSNPAVIYLVQHNFTTNACTLWKTMNAGATWITLPKPAGNSRIATLAVSPEDENIVWLAWVQGGNGQKMYKTTDGGSTWVNITGPELDNQQVQSILPQGGTDGGVYIGTNKTVFYRNNTHSSWQVYASGLPFTISTCRLRPYYRDGKIRMGSYGKAIWEADWYEPHRPVAQPTVDKLESQCLRDTFYFEDYSMLPHSGATWNWTFTGPAQPAFVSSNNARNPKVVFASTGTYTVSLTVTDGSGQSDTKTIAGMITVMNACGPDSVPGMALTLDGNNDYAAAPPLNLNSNTVTISAWVKANGPQNDFAAIAFCRGGTTTAGLSVKSNNELRYHWDGGGWGWSSGIFLPLNEWAHVALVASPTNMKIYVNGVSVTNTTALAAEAFDANLQIGLDNNSSARCFNGLIDEVSIYNRSLSQNEIRELMHLTRDPQSDPSIVAYYQFNEMSGVVLDRSRLYHATLTGNAQRVPSTGPFAKGKSYRTTISGAGAVNFPGTGVTMNFGATHPAGEVVMSRLNWWPHLEPSCNSWDPGCYWVANNYGSNTTITAPSSLTFDSVRVPLTNAVPGNSYELWRRGFQMDGNTWGNALAQSASAVQGYPGSVTFSGNNNFTQLGQIFLSNARNGDQLSICQGDSVWIGSQWRRTTGVYDDTLSTGSGCDSIIARWVDVGILQSVNANASVCPGDSIFLGGAWQTQPGTYQDTLQGAGTCDTLLITTLTTGQIIQSGTQASICQGDSVYLGGGWQTQAGSYQDIYASAGGCDSIVTTQLTVNINPVTNTTANLCPGDSIFAGGAWQTTAGTYTDVLTSPSGCDSTVHTQVILLNPPSVSITQSHDTLYASAGVSCEWFLNGTSLGGTGSCFWVATQNGMYTVTITDANGCRGTSAAYAYTFTGTGTESGYRFLVYPNPARPGSLLKVETDFPGTFRFELSDALGRTLLEQECAGNCVINLPGLSDGVYVWKTGNASFVRHGKIVIRQ